MLTVINKIDIVAKSDKGMKREHNEDAVIAAPDKGLAILADGMGGYNAGEIASALAIKTVIEKLALFELGELTTQQNTTGDYKKEGQHSPELLALETAIQKSNEVILESANSNPKYNGMGTTIVGVMFHDNRICYAHVGDSRLYRLRNNKLTVMTQDHTLLQELIQRGFYTEEEARQSSNKNLVTRALGIDKKVEVDIAEEAIQVGDIYLMCSDGLNDMLTKEQIHLTINNFNDNLNDMAQELISLANHEGGHDNVSVIISKVNKPFPAELGVIQRVVDWFV